MDFCAAKTFSNPFIWFFSLSCQFLVSCASTNQVSVLAGCDSPLSKCLQGKVVIQMATSQGDVTLELDGDSAPLTTGNFLDLVKRGVYNGTVFHRVVNEPVPFVVQGGDPLSKDPDTPKIQYGTGSFVDPSTGQARFIPLEIKLKTEELPRYGSQINNPSYLDQLQLSHQRGSLSMARSMALDSASAQFYIALRALPELDGRYAVFGKVIKGIDVVDAINQNDRIIEMKVLSKLP